MKELIAFSDDSRVWIYQSDREISEMEADEINGHIRQFCTSWTSHNQKLRATGGVLHNRFVLLVVDESQAGASGCSIDKSVAFVKSLEQHYQLRLLDRLNFAYLKQNIVKVVHRNEFSQKFQAGEIQEDTRVFNNLVKTKQEFLNNWILPLKESWMMRFAKKH